nr:MAG TPA: hypothetical protein [Caudoviricetes sp.]
MLTVNPQCGIILKNIICLEFQQISWSSFLLY